MGAYGGKDVILKIGDGAESAEEFTPVGQLIDISGPSMTRSVVEIAHRGLTDFWKEFLPGLKDAGEVTFNVAFDAALTSHTTWLAEMASEDVRNFELDFPSSASAGATTWSFSGIMTGYAPTGPHEGQLTADIIIKLSGQPSFT